MFESIKQSFLRLPLKRDVPDSQISAKVDLILEYLKNDKMGLGYFPIGMGCCNFH